MQTGWHNTNVRHKAKKRTDLINCQTKKDMENKTLKPGQLATVKSKLIRAQGKALETRAIVRASKKVTHSCLSCYLQNDYLPCPFKGGHYQWMRNLCFAYSMQKSVNKKTTSYICYDDADFCPMKKKFDNEYLSNINKHVKPDFQFYIVTYQKIIETGIMISREDSNWTLLKKWVSDKEEKVRLLIR